MALLEREGAEAAIAAALEGASTGRAAVLFLVGEPGLGKSSLLAECRRHAAASGFTVAAASCSELEASLPFGLLDRLLTGLGAPGTSVEADPEGGRAGDARLRRYSELLAWLRSAAPSPLLLAVDDLHWSDADSVELLSLLCRRLAGLHVAVVAALRPWPAPVREQARMLAGDGFAALSRLEPLSSNGSAALLADRLGDAAGPEVVERLSAACSGNPLLLGESAAAWLRGDDPLAGTASAIGERVFLPRFAGVGGAALELARAASVLGTRFDGSLASELAGASGAHAAVQLDALHAAGLLRPGPSVGLVEFVHPLFRQALYEDLGAGARQALHRRAAEALTARGADPSEVAPHVVASGTAGDPVAVAVLHAAGRDAFARGALSTAASHFEAALRVGGADAPAGLRLELAEAKLATGAVAAAEQVLRAYLEDRRLSAPDRVAGLRLLAQVLLAEVRLAEAKQCSAEASALAESFDPDLAVAVLLDAAFIGWLIEGPRSARAGIANALEVIARLGVRNEWLRADTAAADGYLAVIGGDPAALDELAAATRRQLAAPAGRRMRSVFSWDVTFGYANLAKISERFDDAEQVTLALLGASREQGAVLSYQTMAVTWADALWRIGRVDEAVATLRSAGELSELVPTLAPLVSVGLAHLCYEQGETEESASWRRQLERLAAASGDPPYLRLWLCLFECRSLVAAGRGAEAAGSAHAAARTAERSGVLEPCIVPWHGPAIEALVAAGELAAAEALVRRLEEICAPLACRAPRAVAQSGRALIAWRRNDLEEAEARYAAAVAEHCPGAMPLPEGETLIAYARFLRLTRRAARSRPLLHRALSLLEPAGAKRLAALASEELAAAGGRRSSAPPDGLTAQEERVAALAAEGLTSPEIALRLLLSARTVEHHLGRAYAKLGVHSRRELERAWGRRPSAN